MAPLLGFATLPAADQILLQQFCTGARAERPFALIHKAFEHFAEHNPTAIAAIHNNKTITYGELEAAANVLSHKLVHQGLQPRERVCLVVSRSIEMLVAIIAILKCGCQYLPLDGNVVTDASLFYIVRDAGARFILCLEEFRMKCESNHNSSIVIEVIDGCVEGRRLSPCRLDYSIDPTEGAYMIYTSGTTGKPKGVDVSHGNVTNLLTAAPGNLGIRPGTKVAQLMSVSFDMAAWEIFGTLMNGGTLHIRTSNWTSTLAQVDTIIATPSILGTLPPDEYPNLKVVALAGEPCPQPLAESWSRRVALFNCCGPTEVTIVNTMHRHLPGQDISIGKPVPNTNVYILDESEQPVPVGVSGIMWAGGRCVSRGYLNLPGETKKRFKWDKFARDGTLMYNTGDRGKWRPDGTLEHLGRVDDQIKVRGFRVDLSGVSAVIESYPGVKTACTILFEDQLWAFYEMHQGTQKALVAKHVKESLPYYAVPFQYPYDLLPRTSNGKIDKKELAVLAEVLKRDKLTVRSDARQLIPSPLHLDSSDTSVLSSNSDALSEEGKSEPLTSDLPKGSLPLTNDILEKPQPQTIDLLDKPEPSVFKLPPKRGRHGLRAVRHSFFSLYRRFFSVAFIGNLIAVSILSVRARKPQNLWLTDFAIASSINFTTAILMRQDYVINAIWTTCCSMPRSTPLLVRRYCAQVGIHLGGIHSGCGVAGFMWFTGFTIVATYDAIKLGLQSAFDIVVLTTSWFSIAILIGIIAVAHPKFRTRFHNHFEVAHRLLGWSLLTIFWVQSLSFVASAFSGPHPSYGYAVAHSVDIWFLFVATVSVILPWLRLRRVKVRSEVLSPHAIRLHFDYCTPVPGTAVRIAERPVIESHAFATVAKPGEKGFSLIVSNAGDWTKRQIGRAPSSLYVRGIPACGVLRIVPLFRRVVLVATGSGIGPCLPIVLAKRVPMRIFWSTPNPEETFGREIVDSVLAADQDAVIHNTRTMGKPDMVAITWRLLQESNAEAVCIISNQKLTRKLIYAMETRGMPAYGAIWDS